MGRAEACAGHQHGPERWNWKREKIEVEVIANFQCWLKNPDVRDLVCQNYISPEERERRLREIFGLPPEPPEAAAAAVSGSNPVKPGQTESNQQPESHRPFEGDNSPPGAA
jgi:hypothetical protein